ncbi:MAG TPA: polysaccharide biosynthesis protein [Patescibacteria group bacterium]|nr:polysaccharide biosynthesis protein [Patescibacteria group bacterium]
MTHPKIDGKTVLVTGGAGSIGSELVSKLLNDYQPKQVRIFDNNEMGLFTFTRTYHQNKKARFLLGDIRDKDRVSWALKDVDTVFHAAALKHVELNEYSPFESVKTNVIGTQNVLEAALSNQIETFINISTDKAANPTSTMGASKLLAERLTVGMDYFKGLSKTVFASVRFGNVLNSSGSVVPIFMDQIKSGGPVTITDKRMVRYFMTIPDAVNLIFKAVSVAVGGEIFILKMPALKIWDLAEVMTEKYGSGKIELKETGKKPGEKLYEKIVTRTEAEQTLELKDMYVIPLSIDYPSLAEDVVKKSHDYYRQMGGKPVPNEGVKPEKLMSKSEISQLLTVALGN